MEVAGQHAEMPIADIAAIFIALAQFTGSVYPNRLDLVDSVLTSCYKVPCCSAAAQSRVCKLVNHESNQILYRLLS